MRSALQQTGRSAIDAPTNGRSAIDAATSSCSATDAPSSARIGSSCVARWHLVLQVEFLRDGTGHHSCRFKSSCTFLCDKQHPRSTVLWDVAHNWLAQPVGATFPLRPVCWNVSRDPSFSLERLSRCNPPSPEIRCAISDPPGGPGEGKFDRGWAAAFRCSHGWGRPRAAGTRNRP